MREYVKDKWVNSNKNSLFDLFLVCAISFLLVLFLSSLSNRIPHRIYMKMWSNTIPWISFCGKVKIILVIDVFIKSWFIKKNDLCISRKTWNRVVQRHSIYTRVVCEELEVELYKYENWYVKGKGVQICEPISVSYKNVNQRSGSPLDQAFDRGPVIASTYSTVV